MGVSFGRGYLFGQLYGGLLYLRVGRLHVEKNLDRKALLISGLGLGAAYGLVRPELGDVSRLRAGVVLGLAAMVGSDGAATALGVTDPTQYDLNSWLSDIVPHLAYGLVTVATYETLARSR